MRVKLGGLEFDVTPLGLFPNIFAPKPVPRPVYLWSCATKSGRAIPPRLKDGSIPLSYLFKMGNLAAPHLEALDRMEHLKRFAKAIAPRKVSQVRTAAIRSLGPISLPFDPAPFADVNAFASYRIVLETDFDVFSVENAQHKIKATLYLPTRVVFRRVIHDFCDLAAYEEAAAGDKKIDEKAIEARVRALTKITANLRLEAIDAYYKPMPTPGVHGWEGLPPPVKEEETEREIKRLKKEAENAPR